MNDLQALKPKTITLKIDGADLDVSPMRVGAWAAFLSAAKPFLDGLGGDAKELGLSTLMEHPEALVAALSVATKLTVQKVESLYPDEFAGLLQAVLTVNADFFTLRVKPAFDRFMTSVTAMQGGG